MPPGTPPVPGTDEGMPSACRISLRHADVLHSAALPWRPSATLHVMGTVVIGYLPTPEGEAALVAGMEEARRRGARLVVIHTRHGDREEVDLNGVRAALVESGVTHEVRVVAQGEQAADELVSAAEETDAELIVIGLRRRSRVGKLILGSNAQRVVLDAPCPVLTVKPR